MLIWTPSASPSLPSPRCSEMKVKSDACSVITLQIVHACKRGARFAQDLSMDKPRRAARKNFGSSTCGFVNGKMNTSSKIQLSGSNYDLASVFRTLTKSNVSADKQWCAEGFGAPLRFTLKCPSWDFRSGIRTTQRHRSRCRAPNPVDWRNQDWLIASTNRAYRPTP